MRTKKIWVHQTDSFKKAAEFEFRYYHSLSPSRRLATVQFLREQVFKLKKNFKNGNGRKGLRRVIKVIQQA